MFSRLLYYNCTHTTAKRARKNLKYIHASHKPKLSFAVMNLNVVRLVTVRVLILTLPKQTITAVQLTYRMRNFQKSIVVSYNGSLGTLYALLISSDSFPTNGRPLRVGCGQAVLFIQGGVDYPGSRDGDLGRQWEISQSLKLCYPEMLDVSSSGNHTPGSYTGWMKAYERFAASLLIISWLQ